MSSSQDQNGSLNFLATPIGAVITLLALLLVTTLQEVPPRLRREAGGGDQSGRCGTIGSKFWTNHLDA